MGLPRAEVTLDLIPGGGQDPVQWVSLVKQLGNRDHNTLKFKHVCGWGCQVAELVWRPAINHILNAQKELHPLLFGFMLSRSINFYSNWNTTMKITFRGHLCALGKGFSFQRKGRVCIMHGHFRERFLSPEQ